jgi:membrane associated rhomboid family serine protease
VGPLQVIRSTRDRRQADGWTLALASQGIESRLRGERGEWHLAVHEDRAEQAHALLQAFDLENAPPPPEPPPPPEYGPTSVGIVLAVALLVFFGFTGESDLQKSWFARGGADASAILAGELWRTVTALTLHADLPHVLANALSSLLFVTAVCRSYGPGAGGLLILLAGAGGNLLNALYQEPHHLSVGASTALFGAIGILAGTQFARRRRRRLASTRAWIPLAGALGLLAMLGTGERADVFAHLFGLLCGVALGTGAGTFLRRPPAKSAQALLASSVLASVVLAWVLALETI